MQANLKTRAQQKMSRSLGSFEGTMATKKGDEVMNETVSKAVLSGLGFASLTRDAIRETARDLVKKSKLTEDEGRRVVKEFERRLAPAERALAQKVNAAVRKALKQLDLEPSRQPKSAKTSAKNNLNRRHKKASAH